MTRRRLQLWGNPQQLTGFDAGNAFREASQRLRELRDDTELTLIEVPSPDSVRIVLLVGPSVRDEDLYEIAAELRETLGIGAGPTVLTPEGGLGEVRGIGGRGSICKVCGQSDGTHRRGCPNSRR